MPITSQKEIEIQFHKEMLSIYENTKKVGYNATRFRQMVANQGGLSVAKKFINNNNPSEGFTSLWELGRIDLTVEALILKSEYQSLFSEEERNVVRERLSEYGFELEDDIVDNENDIDTNTIPMNTWIFQGNPKIFDIDSYVDKHKYIWWSLRQVHFFDQVAINDEVFLWRSDGIHRGTGGIIAKARIISLPLEQTEDEEAEDYWFTEEGADSYLVIKLEVLEVRLNDGFISRLSLLEDEILKDLLILRLRQQTNYLISNEHAKKLNQLWSSNSIQKDSSDMQIENWFEVSELEPVERSREYNLYEDFIKSSVVYEYLFHSRTHRWLDENIIALDSSESRGYQSMGILHHIGLKGKHKGLFKGYDVQDAIHILEKQNTDFQLVLDRLVDYKNNIERLKISIDDIDSELSEEETYHKDGSINYYYGKRYERNPQNRARAIEIHGLECKACGFNFERIYGERGKDFIEIHHVEPLNNIKEEVVINPETDLAPVCSNCHRMIHRKKDKVLTIEELKELIKNNIGEHLC